MKKVVVHEKAGGNAVYGLGVIGAAIYYITNASGFVGGCIGFLKALVWPIFLIYKLFVFTEGGSA